MQRHLRRGRGGKVKNLFKKFENVANGTYDEHFGSKKTIPFLERAKALPGSVVVNREKSSRPMAECLQSKSCDLPTVNLVRGDPHKIRSLHENLIGQLRQEKIETIQ